MRLAILSDIHGNPVALDAVLADIQSQGEVDAYWVLGDFAALGYDPVTPLQKVTALSHASFTRGNTDRYVVTQDLPVQPEKALEDPALLPEVDVGSRISRASNVMAMAKTASLKNASRCRAKLRSGFLWMDDPFALVLTSFGVFTSCLSFTVF